MKSLTKLLTESFQQEHSCSMCKLFAVTPIGKLCNKKNKVIQEHGKELYNKWMKLDEDSNQCKYFKKNNLNEAIYRNSDVEFIGYQESRSSKPIACFNILNTKSNKYGSTVTLETLKRLNLQIPSYPSFEEWKRSKSSSI